MENGENGNGNGNRVNNFARFLNQWQGVLTLISFVVIALIGFNKLDKTVAVLETTVKLTTQGVSTEVKAVRNQVIDLNRTVASLRTEVNELRAQQLVPALIRLGYVEKSHDRLEKEIDALKK